MSKKLILLGAVTVMVMSFFTEMTGIQKVEAAEIRQTYEIAAYDIGIVPYADSIVRKYRVKDGKLQYRRWNETKGYWVDSDWIIVP